MAKKKSMKLSPKISKDSLPQEQMDKIIRDVAYNLYEQRNYVPGNDLDDWLEAEKIVKNNSKVIF